MKLLLALALLVPLGGIAGANPQRRQERQAEKQMILEHFDANHDGVLDRRERHAARREMRQLGRQLRKQDRMERRERRLARREGRRQQPMQPQAE